MLPFHVKSLTYIVQPESELEAEIRGGGKSDQGNSEPTNTEKSCVKKRLIKKTCIAASLYLSGSPTWTRTRDLRINSPSLYQLSYQGIDEGAILMTASVLVNMRNELRARNSEFFHGRSYISEMSDR
jgi:hypothetical protein